MNKEHLENGDSMENTQETNSYQRYLELGGIINEGHYNEALEAMAKVKTSADIAWLLRERSKEEDPEIVATHTRTLVRQAEGVADSAGIELHNSEDALDSKTILFIILRTDKRMAYEKHHHDQMFDQNILVEALRMLGDTESIEKMIKAYPNISFEYKRETGK